MSQRIIGSPTTLKEFPPMVSIRTAGNFVTGTILETGVTVNGNPFINLALKDLEGSTQKSVSKGVYQEVEVKEGDVVAFVGANKQLRDKLPLLQVGQLTTIKFLGKKKLKSGRSINEYEVSVEE